VRATLVCAVQRRAPADGPMRRENNMPEGSSKKRERQYEHIKESYQERGVSSGEAKERAARTVNKARRKAGETKKKK
jgi:hypothetical protein